jgi:5-formyltetrahydrofolate cyclo-ligase
MTDQAETAPPEQATKATWRRWARRQRAGRSLDPEDHQRALARFLASAGRRPGWVVAYQALGDEIALDGLMERAELGPFALTRTPEHGADLTVHPAVGPRERHRFGFTQPVAGSPAVDDIDLAVILVPGLLFDRAGGRLGRGGGYYDRFLARLGSDVALVGITGGMVVDLLPTDDHDVAMTHLADADRVWKV